MKSVFFSALLVGSLAQATNSGISYEGQIIKPNGTPLSGTSAQFKMQIRTPDAGACLMYEEVQTLNMSSSNGNFALTLNDGTGSRTDATTLTLDRIFANRGAFTFDPSTCASGSSYTPGSNDGRSLVVLFKDETMSGWEPVPAEKINFAPLAIEAKQIAGYTADSLLRVTGGDGVSPITGLAPLSNAQYNELLNLINGNSTQYAKASSGGGAIIGTSSNPSAPSVGTMWYNTTSNQLMVQGTGGVQTVGGGIASVNAVAPLISTTAGGVVNLSMSPTGVTTGTYGSATQVPIFGIDNFGRITSATTVPLTSSPTGAAGGDLGGSFPNPSVINVGGSTAANVHGAELLANAAASTNTAYAIVKRDGSGNFIASAVTANSLSLNNGGSYLTITNPIGGAWNMTLPVSAGSPNQVLTTNGSGVTSWSTPATSPWTTSGSNIVYLAGNVGIGTTSPSVALDVSGSVNVASGKMNFGSVSGLIVGPNSSAMLGLYAGSNSTGAYNVGVGPYALASNTTGSDNIAVGYQTLSNGSSAAFNTAVGSRALSTNSAGYNVAVGYQALTAATSSAYGTSVGAQSGVSVTTGQKNTFLGSQSGQYVSTGSSNTLLGYQAGQYITGSHNVVIGDALTGMAGDYNLAIGSSGLTTIYGNLQSGNVGIGTTSPAVRLQVVGAIVSNGLSTSTSTLDFSQANVQYTTSTCGSFQLFNMKDGGSYKFIVKSATSAMCSFTAYSDGGSTALTVRSSGLASTVASTHTMFEFTVAGSDVYVREITNL